MEHNLKKNENGRRPRRRRKMEDNLTKIGRQHKNNEMEDDLKIKLKWKINQKGRHPQPQFKKNTLIGCDIIVN